MRLLTLAVLAVAFAGCTLTYRSSGSPYYADEGGTYSYAGEHPIPDAYGGGWCSIGAPHTHEYAPNDVPELQYVNDQYVYQEPMTFYYDVHPIPFGGYCAIHGRHAHPYAPGADWGSYYAWNPGYGGYVYRNPGNYHGASPVLPPPRPAYHSVPGYHAATPHPSGGFGRPAPAGRPQVSSPPPREPPPGRPQVYSPGPSAPPAGRPQVHSPPPSAPPAMRPQVHSAPAPSGPPPGRPSVSHPPSGEPSHGPPPGAPSVH